MNQKPFFSKKKLVTIMKKLHQEITLLNSKTNVNLLPNGTDWTVSDTALRMDICYRRRMQQLCKNIVSFQSRINCRQHLTILQSGTYHPIKKQCSTAKIASHYNMKFLGKVTTDASFCYGLHFCSS